MLGDFPRLLVRGVLGLALSNIVGCTPTESDSGTPADEVEGANEDADEDGVLTQDDCDDHNNTLGAQLADADCDGTLTAADCDDTDAASTIVAEDGDCDTTLTADDCDDNDAASTIVAEDGDCDTTLTAADCDDNDATSTIVATDADCDTTLTADDCDDNDATSTIVATDADCDTTLTADDCDDNDAASTIVATDWDCDTTLTADDCDDTDATSTIVATDWDCDTTPTADDCDDADPASTILATDWDCDTTLTADDCDDADPASTILATDWDCDTTLTADDCDDNDATSTIVATDWDCDTTATADDCDDTDATSTIVATDWDCDTTLTADDCDDNDATSTIVATDADCDTTLTADDCDDNDATSTIVATDWDCDTTLTADDCDDTDATSTIVATDADCDTTLTADDCDDTDATSTIVATDADCDTTLTAGDCDDTDATSTIVAEDGDCDATLTADDCDDTDATSTIVATDADCDTTLTAADCDDTDATSTIVATDADCDTTGTAADCDDTDATSTIVATDADCDTTLTAADCDDTDATSTIVATDADCNGTPDDEEPLATWSGEYDLEDMGDVVLGERYEDMAGRTFAGGEDLTGDGYVDLLVGARGADHGTSNNGAAYVVPGPISGERELADEARLWEGHPSYTTAYAGATVAIADIDADGQSDMVVGAYLSNSQRGAVYVEYGPITGGGELASADVAWAGGYDSGVGAMLGYSMAELGDVTGDGQADFAMGAPLAKVGLLSSAGTVYVIEGGETLPTNLAYANVTISGAGSGDMTGHALGEAGDVNGDGVYDLVLYGDGTARLYLGPLSGGNTTADSDGTFGSTMSEYLKFAGPGDVGGDGLDDVLLGTYAGGVGGEVYLFEDVSGGTRSTTSADATWVHEQVSAAFGSSVSGAGDVNRDGFADVVMGAPADDEHGTSSGAAFLALGPASGKHPVTDTDAVFFGDSSNANAGDCVRGVGDMNDDGVDDFAVSAMVGHDAPFWAGTVTILQ